jgi:hypothetical protein
MTMFTSTARDPEQQVLARELSAVLKTVVDALPETYRSVFMLREIEGMNTARDRRVPQPERGDRPGAPAPRTGPAAQRAVCSPWGGGGNSILVRWRAL